MNVLITGATGLIGSRLCEVLIAGGHAVRVLSRRPEAARQRLRDIDEAYSWDPLASVPPPQALERSEVVVHLAGESVSGRWTAAKCRAIRDSRVIGTRNLVAGMRLTTDGPRALISASAIGYYGDRGDEPLTEESEPGSDFLAEICKSWESEAAAAAGSGVRVARLRFGIVLGHGGGALKEMLRPARLGLSGPLGSGSQWWSWIHLEDALRLVVAAVEGELSGPYNTTAPTPIRQRDFATALGKQLRRPAFLPAPAFALKLVLGGFATELLSSKKVLPERSREAGHGFHFPDLESALRDLLA